MVGLVGASCFPLAEEHPSCRLRPCRKRGPAHRQRSEVPARVSPSWGLRGPLPERGAAGARENGARSPRTSRFRQTWRWSPHGDSLSVSRGPAVCLRPGQGCLVGVVLVSATQTHDIPGWSARPRGEGQPCPADDPSGRDVPSAPGCARCFPFFRLRDTVAHAVTREVGVDALRGPRAGVSLLMAVDQG